MASSSTLHSDIKIDRAPAARIADRNPITPCPSSPVPKPVLQADKETNLQFFKFRPTISSAVKRFLCVFVFDFDDDDDLEVKVISSTDLKFGACTNLGANANFGAELVSAGALDCTDNLELGSGDDFAIDSPVDLDEDNTSPESTRGLRDIADVIESNPNSTFEFFEISLVADLSPLANPCVEKCAIDAPEILSHTSVLLACASNNTSVGNETKSASRLMPLISFSVPGRSLNASSLNLPTPAKSRRLFLSI